LFPTVYICYTLLLSTKTPVNAHKNLLELPAKNKGIPGRVYEKILLLLVYLLAKTTGLKN